MQRSINSNYLWDNTCILIHGENEIVSDSMVRTNNFFEIDFLDYIAKKIINKPSIMII